MDNKTYIFEGKTTNEAIEKGLRELKTTKNKVEIKECQFLSNFLLFLLYKPNP